MPAVDINQINNFLDSQYLDVNIPGMEDLDTLKLSATAELALARERHMGSGQRTFEITQNNFEFMQKYERRVKFNKLFINRQNVDSLWLDIEKSTEKDDQIKKLVEFKQQHDALAGPWSTDTWERICSKDMNKVSSTIEKLQALKGEYESLTEPGKFREIFSDNVKELEQTISELTKLKVKHDKLFDPGSKEAAESWQKLDKSDLGSLKDGINAVEENTKATAQEQTKVNTKVNNKICGFLEKLEKRYGDSSKVSEKKLKAIRNYKMNHQKGESYKDGLDDLKEALQEKNKSFLYKARNLLKLGDVGIKNIEKEIKNSTDLDDEIKTELTSPRRKP